MDIKQATELGKTHVENAETLCVTSDGGVFINNDIKAMKAHADSLKLEIFVLKGEEKKAEKPAEEVKTSKKDKKKK